MRYLSWLSVSSLALSACFNPNPGGGQGGGTSSTDAGSTGVPGTTGASISGTSLDGTGSTTNPIDPTNPMTGSTTDPTTGVTTDPTGDPPGTSTGDTDGGESSGTTTGVEPCPAVGPAGYPGSNPPYIWVANSSEGTISKINTQTMVEEGRYLTREDAQGSPSRTSVSLDGDVAVANRSGGLTKFWGDTANCVDANGDGMITTSVDAVPLAWADEECRAWFLPGNYASQRPVAWTAGTQNPNTCLHDDERVWTSGASDVLIEVLSVNGETGVLEDTVAIPDVAPNFYGLYGGAVDQDGNFWASQLGTGTLVRVDAATFTYDTWPMPTSGYGMTVGASGYVFTCASSVGRFDPVTELWDTAQVGGSGGCIEDAQGRLWLANDPMIAIDVQTLAVVESVDLPEYVHGVGVDFDGLVWGVSLFGTDAYRFDPVTGGLDTFTGLFQPYTYSDMTGFALAAVTPGP